jgi:hypothetical protein
VQGALGIAGNYSNSNNDTYSDSNSPSQMGGAASAQMGVLLNINNQFVIGPTIGYMNATTNSKIGEFGNDSWTLNNKTTVPSLQYGVLGGIKFAEVGMFYLTMGYATGGMQNVELNEGAKTLKSVNIDLNQAYMGIGGRYNVTPNLYIGLEYTAYNILNTSSYNFQYTYKKDGRATTIFQPINTSVGIFNVTFGMNF